MGGKEATPLIRTAPWKRPRLRGDRVWTLTQNAPAEPPVTVTDPGSPPKFLMLSLYRIRKMHKNISMKTMKHKNHETQRYIFVDF